MRPATQPLTVLSLLLPLLKCAICPACLSLYGGLFASARLGAAGFGHLPAWLLGVALVADVVILYLAFRHHRKPGPIMVCLGAGLLVIMGHVAADEVLELAGFVALIATAFWNWWLLRKHHRAPESTCNHCAHHHSARA